MMLSDDVLNKRDSNRHEKAPVANAKREGERCTPD
jgi:hypothetical protein